MPSVLEAFPTAQLVILGEGPLKRALQEQAQTLKIAGSVSFPGFQKNPWAYLKHASAFVLPSRYEGLPNIMLEALALWDTSSCFKLSGSRSGSCCHGA